MKIKDIALSAAAIGERVVKAIAIGAVEVWSASKYIVFKDKVVEQICVANFSSDGVGVTEEDAAKVTSIGTIFKENTEITSFKELRKFGITSIEREAFIRCSNLASIALPDSLKVIKATAFAYDTALKSISIPDSVTTMTDEIFYGCSSLAYAKWPQSVTIIPLFTFYNCVNLLQVDIPDSIERIRYNSFGGCQKLSYIKIPKSLKEVEQNAFKDCKGLEYVEVDDLNTLFNIRYYNLESCPLFYAGELRQGGVVVRHIDIPDSVEIKNYALAGAKNVESVTIPSMPASIGAAAFRLTGLKHIDIPESVTYIGEVAFLGCDSLRYAVIRATTPPQLGTSAFGDIESTYTIYVPDASVEAYKTASNWSTYASRIKPLSEYVES